MPPNKDTSQNIQMKSAFEDIVTDMHILYDNKITDTEAHEAAINLIEFCKCLMDC